jgi:hypothetical protein
MRLRIPLVPFAVGFERRPLEPIRLRLTIRRSMILVALLAVVVWFYVTRVTMPAVRQRWQRADGIFHLHLAVLDGAYREYVKQESDCRAAAQRCFESSERENREADRWPEAEEERTTHRDFAVLWDKSRSQHLWAADLVARRVHLLKERMDGLMELRRQVAGSIRKMEEVAKEAEKWPETTEWNLFAWAPNSPTS